MKRKLKLTLLFVIFFIIKSFGNQNIHLSPESQISVITCGVGEQLYSSFGHTALRVKDKKNNLDLVFNYGTFDFNTSNFYLKFSRGTLKYYLDVTTFSRFIRQYTYENRALFEQVLNLTNEEKNRLFSLLNENLKPKNKYYRYQFFKDNCTTRIYHLLEEASNSTFSIDSSYIERNNTYRELFSSYLEKTPWVDIGLNLCLGIQADQVTTVDERIFLPFEFMEALNNSYLQKRPFVKENITLFLPHESIQNEKGNLLIFNPLFIVCIIAISLLCISLFTSYSRGVDVIVFGTSSLIGAILFYLSIFSLHTPTHYNLNLLWLSPFSLILLLRESKIRNVYSKFYLVILVLAFLLNCFVGYFTSIFYPFTILMIVRLFILNYKRESSFGGKSI